VNTTIKSIYIISTCVKNFDHINILLHYRMLFYYHST